MKLTEKFEQILKGHGIGSNQTDVELDKHLAKELGLAVKEYNKEVVGEDEEITDLDNHGNPVSYVPYGQKSRNNIRLKIRQRQEELL